MATGISFAVIVKILCMAGNVIVQVSPYPQVKRWALRGCTGEADAAPYVSIAFGGWQWCAYGAFAWLVTKRSGFLILVHSNCLGALLGSYYVYTFYSNCRNQFSLNTLNLYLSAVASLALLQVCTVFVLPPERALFLVGLVSSFCSFVGALSMLVTLPSVLRTEDSRSIPGTLAIANLGCSCVWLLCGYMLADPLVTCPNVVAVGSSCLCIYVKSRYPSQEDAEQGLAASRKGPSEFTHLTAQRRPSRPRGIGTGPGSVSASPSDANRAAPESTMMESMFSPPPAGAALLIATCSSEPTSTSCPVARFVPEDDCDSTCRGTSSRTTSEAVDIDDDGAEPADVLGWGGTGGTGDLF